MTTLIQNRFISGLEKKYAQHLHELVDEIYEVAAKKWTWSEFAENAGVSYSTISNLGNRKTRYPRHMTIWKMAQAVGLQAEMVRIIQRKAG